MQSQFEADLERMGLSQFAAVLLDEGIEQAADLAYLEDSELEEMGLKRVHVRKLRAIARNPTVKLPAVAEPQKVTPGACASPVGAQGAEAEAPLRPRVDLALEPAMMAKKVGNQMMKGGDHAGAAGMYKHGIEMVVPLLPVAFANPDVQFSILDAYYALRINAAHCSLKQSDFRACIHHAQKVLDLEPNSAPALYRRGQALAMLDSTTDLQWALRDFERVVALDPSNQCAQQQLLSCRARLSELAQRLACKLTAGPREGPGAQGWELAEAKAAGKLGRFDTSAIKVSKAVDEDDTSTQLNSPSTSGKVSVAGTPPSGSPRDWAAGAGHVEGAAQAPAMRAPPGLDMLRGRS